MISPLTAGITLVVALLVLGPKNLPELAKGAGKALSEFKKAANSLEDDLQTAPKAAAAPLAPPAEQDAAAPTPTGRG